MLGRFCYSLLPIILTLGTLALALVSFFGSFRTNSAGLTNIYFLRLDFSDIKVSGFSASSLLTSAGIYPVYQVGANGYCYGDFSGSNVDISGCKTPTTPFWFDLLRIFQESSAGNILDSVNLPDEISSYENILKAASYAVWSLLIAVSCLSFIIFIMGVFSALSKGLSVCIFLVSILNVLCALAGAAAATGLYKVYRDKFNQTVSTFGATASMGTAALGLIWGMAAAALLACLFWAMTMCCGSTSRKNRDHSSIEKTDYDHNNTHY